MTEWNTLDTLPKDRPVLMICWWDHSKFDDKPGHWSHMGVFQHREPPPHDKSMVAVSLSGTYWLRGGITVNGKNVLDPWRWADIPPMPEPLS